MILVFALTAAGIPIPGYASSIQASLTSPQSGQVFQPGSVVNIAGTAQGLSEVSITVRNEQGGLVYTAQPKVADGMFTTSFTLDSGAAEGKYTITLSGLGLSVKKYKFEVSNTSTEIELQSPSNGQEFKAGDVVEISGTATSVSQLAVSVRNSKNGRVFVAQPSVVDGSFTTCFTLSADAMSGEYTIAVTASGLAAAKTSFFKVTTGGGSGGGGTNPDAILFIKGSGVSNEISFTRAQLEAMSQERVLYSTTSDMPQDKPVAAEGVLLRNLLNQAGMSGAKTITFQGSDGYAISFTVDELLNTTRYKFPDLTEVEPLIALKRVEGTANFDEMTTTDTPVICYGQRAKTEQTLLGFVKRLKYITVTPSSPGQWSKPVAKIQAPDSAVKTVTQSGTVASGSKIYLEAELTTNIYYATDSSIPDLDSEIFNKHGCGPLQGQVDPVVVSQTTTVKAIAVGRGKQNSDVLSLTFVAGGTTVTGGGGNPVPQQAVSDKNIAREELNLENGRKGEKITLQAGALEDTEKGEPGRRLVIASTADVDEVITEIPAAVLQKAQEKGMLLGIDSRIGNYTLPLAALKLNEIADGMGVKLEDLSLNIKISKATEDMKKTLNSHIREGQQILVDPVGFTVEITAPGGKKVEYKSFGGAYVERELALSCEVDVNQSTGAHWNEAKGQFSPVPTRFVTRNGICYAVILNRTNSLYTVLQASKTFSDIQDNWAKKDIELLASKMLIAGKSETAYEPGSSITRAEFSALLVRALGLEEGVLSKGQFKDVDGAAWYAGSIAAAVAENIIKGYDGGFFKPDNKITREEMAVMIVRATRVAGKEDTLSGSEQKELLARFKDQQKISSWAASDAALAVKAGIISGMPDGGFSPGNNADRAQSAAILKRFLIYINFITVR
jgi:hypothetical protein